MKNFLKDKTWDDYYLYVTFGIMILGFILFLIGFYYGFEQPGLEGTPLNGKTNVANILKQDNSIYTILIDGWNDSWNLFDLAGNIDSSLEGALFAMVVVSILGFSFIMLSLFLMVLVIIIGFTIDIIRRKEKK